MGFYQTAHKGLTVVERDEFLIESEADLANLPECVPGSRAYTADGSGKWMKDVDGTWADQVGISADDNSDAVDDNSDA